MATMVQSDFEHFQMSGSIITRELFLSLTSCWLDMKPEFGLIRCAGCISLIFFMNVDSYIYLDIFIIN
jgi:hypothetical protein